MSLGTARHPVGLVPVKVAHSDVDECAICPARNTPDGALVSDGLQPLVHWIVGSQDDDFVLLMWTGLTIMVIRTSVRQTVETEARRNELARMKERAGGSHLDLIHQGYFLRLGKSLDAFDKTGRVGRLPRTVFPFSLRGTPAPGSSFPLTIPPPAAFA